MKDLRYYLEKAMNEKFAIGAFNFSNLETLQAIAEACKENNSPAFISVSESALNYMGDYLLPLAKKAKELHCGLFLHLDHGRSFEICKKAIDLGFDSVMIDGSSLDFETNISLTQKVCDYAHKKGVLVEGELGQIKGIEEQTQAENDTYTNPIQAKTFAEKTGVDMLAISIGTSHGAYKNFGNNLKFDILTEIETLLPKLPLVLHGASNVSQQQIDEFISVGGALKKAGGINQDQIVNAVKNHNIIKVNTDTDIRLSLTCGVREILQDSSQFDPRKYLAKGREKVQKIVGEKIRNLLFSNDKI